MTKKDVQRFLWPKKALGRPVKMRMPPRTPKAGSMTVSSVMGMTVGVAEVVLEGAMVDVTVTLYVVGTRALRVTLWPPESSTEVIKMLLVVWATNVVREGEPGDGVEDCAAATARRERVGRRDHRMAGETGREAGGGLGGRDRLRSLGRPRGWLASARIRPARARISVCTL